jgi:hypothetical protein
LYRFFFFLLFECYRGFFFFLLFFVDMAEFWGSVVVPESLLPSNSGHRMVGEWRQRWGQRLGDELNYMIILLHITCLRNFLVISCLSFVHFS